MQSELNFQDSDGLVLSDRDLIDVQLSGAENAFEQLVQRYQERLTFAILKIVGSREMAEDIVQDAFTKAFLHLPSFRGDCGFYTWLFRIALNSRRDYFRMSKGTVSLESIDDAFHPEGLSQRNSPSADAERLEDCNQVQEALSRLNTRNRTILVLRELEFLDYATISRTLQIPIGTVRSRLCRARAELRLELASYHDAVYG